MTHRNPPPPTGQNGEADFILFVANVQAASDSASRNSSAAAAPPVVTTAPHPQLPSLTAQLMRPPMQSYSPTLPLPSTPHVLPPILSQPRPAPRKLAPHGAAATASFTAQPAATPMSVTMVPMAQTVVPGPVVFNGFVPSPHQSVPRASTVPIAANPYMVSFAGARGPNTTPSSSEAADSPSSQSRRYRESHNEVERRRRESINQIIAELASMVPDCYPGQSKGAILRKAADYIRRMQGRGPTSGADGHPSTEVKCEPPDEVAAEQSAVSAATAAGMNAVKSTSNEERDSADNVVLEPSNEADTSTLPLAVRTDKRTASSDDDSSASESASEDDADSADAKRPRIEGESCPIEAKPAGYNWKRTNSWPTTDSVPTVPLHALPASAVNVMPL